MASGERGKAIEEAVAGFRKGQEVIQGRFDINQALIQGQQGQFRTDFNRQRGLTEEGLDPFIQAGTTALQDVQQGATIGGLEERIASILSGDAFQSLKQERVGDLQTQLAASGLSRSGLALQEIASISPELAFQLENQLFGRSRDLSNVGFKGVERRGALGNQLTIGQGQLSGGLTELEARLGENLGLGLAQGFQGIGEAQSQGRLQALAAKEKRGSAINRFIGSAAGVGANILLPGSGGFVQAGVTSGLEAF